MSTVTKKRMTLGQAADQWERAKREIDRLKPQLEEAAAVLLEHFQKTGRKTFRDRIGLVQGPPRTILDQAKIREFLGAQLHKFQKRSTPKPSLTLLHDEPKD